MSFPLFSLDLAVDVLHVVSRKTLSLSCVEILSSLCHNFLHASVGLLSSLLVSLGMRYSQELVVGIIDVQLEGMTVIGEKSVVSIGQVSQSTSLEKD